MTDDERCSGLAALKASLPAGTVVTDPDVLASYAHDQSQFTDHVLPLAVLMPSSTDEVARCLRALHDLGVAVVPRGPAVG